MNQFLKRISTLFFGKLLPTFTFADPFWVFDLEVRNLVSDWNGTVQASFNQNSSVYTPCSTVDSYTFSLSDVGGDSMNSYLLTALATKSKIAVLFTCNGNKIVAVRLENY